MSAQPFLFVFTVLLLILLHSKSHADNTNLVYKSCANQTLHDPSEIYSQNLKTLLVSLLSQSEKNSFFTSIIGEDKNVIMGLYQCRGDISNSACYNCVSMILKMLDMLCGKVVAARVQLVGCYLRYEVVGYEVVQSENTQLLYKVCESKKGSYFDHDDGFEERREFAFGMVENGVRNGGNLFYTWSYQSLYMLGQCEGDLANDECGDCVKSAEDQAKAECADSISAQIYLKECFISYSFCSKGLSPVLASPGSPRQQNSTLKTVAITVGAIAALGSVIVCFLAVKSTSKKKSNDDGYYSDSYSRDPQIFF